MAKEEGSPAGRLRRVIRDRGLKIGEFADLIGEKSQRVSDVLTGRQRIPEAMLSKMTEHGFDVSYVLSGDSGKVVLTDKADVSEFLRTGEVARLVTREIILLNNYRRSPEPQKKILEDTAASFAAAAPKLNRPAR